MMSSNNNNANYSSCKKLDDIAAWVCHGVSTAFFASLDWFACMHVDTRDASDHDDPSFDLSLISKPDHMEDSSIEIMRDNI